jgi:hypothetical protein
MRLLLRLFNPILKFTTASIANQREKTVFYNLRMLTGLKPEPELHQIDEVPKQLQKYTQATSLSPHS